MLDSVEACGLDNSIQLVNLHVPLVGTEQQVRHQRPLVDKSRCLRFWSRDLDTFPGLLVRQGLIPSQGQGVEQVHMDCSSKLNKETWCGLTINAPTILVASYIGSMHEPCVGVQYFSSKTCLSKTDQLSSI